MLSHSKIKYLKSLHQKKYRIKEKKILLEGVRLIKQVLSADAEIIKIWATEKLFLTKAGQFLKRYLEEKNVTIEITSEKSILRISDIQNSQGIIALSPLVQYPKSGNLPQKAIYLDHVSDPGNMGSIIRTAIWFGINDIFLSEGCVDPFNPKVLRSAMGGHFYLNNLSIIHHEKLFKDYLDADYGIIASELKGESIVNVTKKNRKGWILILGSEAQGIDGSLKPYITQSISVPGSGKMESLNVSIASGIILYMFAHSPDLLQTEKK